MLFKWDRMTRLERRTRATICEVVGTAEGAMERVVHPQEHERAGGYVRMVADAFAYLALALLFCSMIYVQLFERVPLLQGQPTAPLHEATKECGVPAVRSVAARLASRTVKLLRTRRRCEKSGTW